MGLSICMTARSADLSFVVVYAKTVSGFGERIERIPMSLLDEKSQLFVEVGLRGPQTIVVE
jgi:hypothetical protein